jgi:hypothetical protein
VQTRAYYGDETALEALDKAHGLRTLVLQMPEGGGVRLARRYDDARSEASHFAMLLLDESMVHYELVTYRGLALMDREELPARVRALLAQQEEAAKAVRAQEEAAKAARRAERRAVRRAARRHRDPVAAVVAVVE